jgi:amidase
MSTASALHSASVVSLLTALARRERKAETLLHALFEHIDAREPVVRAFAYLDRAKALEQARQCDAGAVRGPLHGLPVGVKDVIDTVDLPTQYGSPIYANHQPKADAAAIALMRRAGAYVLGKAVTTEFATFPPGPTTNPHNPAHTPGGSSSGSAAGVAAQLFPVAFGTQTTGSIIRPASFCGVVGYKPSYGTLPTVGVKAISYCLDTLGVFARSVEDVAAFTGALSGRALAVHALSATPKLGFCLTPYFDAALPEVRNLFATLAKTLSRTGATVKDFSLPAPFEKMNDAQDFIWRFEMARCLSDEHRRHRAHIREPLLGQLDTGLALEPTEYDAAMAIARHARQIFSTALGDHDVLIVPSAPGEAPLGLNATGNPAFNRTWSLLHSPCVHVPYGHGPNGLPIGFQVVGRIGDDARTLSVAHWLQRHLPH